MALRTIQVVAKCGEELVKRWDCEEKNLNMFTYSKEEEKENKKGMMAAYAGYRVIYGGLEPPAVSWQEIVLTKWKSK